MIAAEHPDKSNRFKNKKPHSHRNSADSELSIDPNTGAPIATGDWENIMQFESTTEVRGGSEA